MPQVVIQDVWLPLTYSECLKSPHLLRSDRTPIIQGWICRCVEGEIFRPGCCGEGLENVLDQQLEEDNQRGFRIVLSFQVYIYRFGPVAVL